MSGWRSLLALLLAIAAMGFTATSAWLGRGQIARLLADQDDRTLQGATVGFRQQLDRLREQGLAEVKLLADDARVRGTVVTNRLDEATVRDVLDDLRAATAATVLAVLDTGGKVLAVSGLPALRHSDLSSARTVKAAFEQPGSDVWTFGQQVLAVALAPVRSGPDVRALLLVGAEVGYPALAAVEKAHGVRGALVAADRVLARSSADEQWDPAFRLAASEMDGLRLLPQGDRPLRAMVSRTGDAPTSARAVWIVPPAGGGPAAVLSRILWIPALAVGLMGVLLVALVRR